MTSADMSLVTVLAWPAGWPREQIIAALVEAVGIDPADATLMAPCTTPLVVTLLPAPAAADAVRVFQSKRVGSASVPLSRVRAAQPPIHAKRLIRGAAGTDAEYMVEPWRGDGRVLAMRNVVYIVRGRITKYTRTTTVENIATAQHYRTFDMDTDVSRVSEYRGGRDDALDLYSASGPPVRITGKFDFGSVLGPEKGYSDGENMDRLAVRLSEEAPNAEIDLAFAEFRPPRGLGRVLTVSIVGSQTTAKRDDTALFDFYSAWKSVLAAMIRDWRASRAKP